ncbi:MAG TPA: FHA domain-containing protein [Microbacteriaceae bacterium]|nr:FHA domain-containing protein [Microbacteriaceae bacterium]
MSELTLLVLRIGFLALLWLFVLWVVYALRSDLFGSPARKMKATMADQVAAQEPIASTPAPQPAPEPVTVSSDALPSASDDGPPKKLVILTGMASGSTIPLDSDIVTVGRSPDSTLVIVDEYTSTYHARLDLKGNTWTITDLDSTNGTKVSGSRINSPVVLPPSTPVTIGTTTFELRP